MELPISSSSIINYCNQQSILNNSKGCNNIFNFQTNIACNNHPISTQYINSKVLSVNYEESDDCEDAEDEEEEGTEHENSELEYKRKRLKRQTPNWTIEEDAVLITNQSKYGNKWQMISMLLPGRSKNECHVRFVSIQRAAKREWSVGEDSMLLESAKSCSNDLCEIKKGFPSRTINALRTRLRELRKVQKGVITVSAPPLGSARQLFFHDKQFLERYFPFHFPFPISIPKLSSMNSISSVSTSSIAPIGCKTFKKGDSAYSNPSSRSSSVSNIESIRCQIDICPGDVSQVQHCADDNSHPHIDNTACIIAASSSDYSSRDDIDLFSVTYANIAFRYNNKNETDRVSSVHFANSNLEQYHNDDLFSADEQELINMLLN